MICKYFGFARSMDYSAIEMDRTNASFLKISDDFQRGDSILSNMNETDSCAENKIVVLECEKYSKCEEIASDITFLFINRVSITACGNNLTRDKDAINSDETWPSLAVAINKVSSIRCTATIGII